MFEWLVDLFNSDTFFKLLELWTKSSLILAVAFLATWCAGKASASTRAIIWLCSIFALILLPVATWLGPGLSVSIPLPVTGQDQVRVVGMPPSLDQAGFPEEMVPAAENQVQPSGLLPNLPVTTVSRIRLPVHGLLLSVWLVGMLAVAVWLMRGHRFVHGLLAESRTIDDPHIRHIADQIGAHYGLAAPVAVRASSQVKIPLVCGLIRPTVLLPGKAWRSWSDERKEMVLLHEFAHIARRDVPMRALAHALLPFHWFNPLLWLAINRLSWEQERACDDLVLGAGAKPSLYAKTLLTFAQNGQGPLLMSATQLTGTTIKNRILSVLNPDVQRRPIRRLGMIAIFSVGLTFLMPFAITSVIAADRDETVSTRAEVGDDASSDPGVFADEQPSKRLSEAEIAEAITQLRSAEAHEVANAAIDLRQAEAPQAIPFLLEALADDRAVPNGLLRRNFGDLKEPTTPGREASITLAKMGKNAQSKLMGVIRDRNLVIRANAAFGLGLARNEDAIPLLLEALKDREARVRAESAWSLGMMRHSVAVPALQQALTDEFARVREQSAWGLGMIRDEAGVDGLVVALGDDHAAVRAQASWALGMIRSQAGIEGLVRALNDTSDGVRSQVAWALGMIRGEDAIQGLTGALVDPNDKVRSQAAWALGMIRGEDAIQGLTGALGDPNDTVRSQAAWALGMIRGEDAIQGLTGALVDPNDKVRSQAAWALGMIRGSAGVPRLIEALEDDEVEVRSQAAWALGMIRDQRALVALEKAREDQAEAVRENAGWALGMMGLQHETDL